MMSSRNLSPAAKSLFRPVTPNKRSVAVDPVPAGVLDLRAGVLEPDPEGKEEDKSARPFESGFETSSSCRWYIRLSEAGGKNSIAYLSASQHMNCPKQLTIDIKQSAWKAC